MLTRLREIVEKVASAPRLNEALNILVTDICLAMETEVCSVYLADHDRRCYYLMATRGLKKPRGRTVTLAFDEGIVGWSGDWRSQSTLPMRKNTPASNISLPSKRSGSALSLACRLFSAANCLACLLSSNESCGSTTKARSLSSSRWQRRWLLSSPSLSWQPFWAVSSYPHPRASGLAGRRDCRRLDGCHAPADGAGLRSLDAG